MPRDNESGSGQGAQGVKTLAIRLTETQHAQLSLIAQLAERTLTEEIRLAVEHWIEQSKQSPDFAAQAESVLEEIDREAQNRRSAITALLGAQTKSSGQRARKAKPGGGESTSS